MTIRSILASNAGLLFALTGVLIATSIFNTANSGIPLFYLVIVISLFRSVLPTLPHLTTKFDWSTIAPYVLVGVQATALVLITMAQVLWFSLPLQGEILHLVARVMFLVYFAICLRYLRGGIGYAGLVWARRLLTFFFLYGVYQVPARLLGWPLFLDWLRNNKSYLAYGYDAAGWINMVRATSVYAEPSQATVPMIVAILLNIYLPAGRMSRFVGWISIVLFAAASASRSMWLSIATLVVVLSLTRIRAMRWFLRPRSFAPLAVVILAAAVFPMWAFVAVNNSTNDLSAQDRSGSVVVGSYMIRDAPLIGLGWNSAERLAGSYLSGHSIARAAEIRANFIHNMIVSYWEQAGIVGLVFAILPYILLWRWSTAPLEITWATIASMLIASELGEDIGYYSLTWLWMALLINMDTIEARLAAPTPIEKLATNEVMNILPA